MKSVGNGARYFICLPDVNDTRGSFFYFEDISMGLVAVYDDLEHTTKFMRFTGDIVPEDSFFTGKPFDRDH